MVFCVPIQLSNYKAKYFFSHDSKHLKKRVFVLTIKQTSIIHSFRQILIKFWNVTNKQTNKKSYEMDMNDFYEHKFYLLINLIKQK